MAADKPSEGLEAITSRINDLMAKSKDASAAATPAPKADDVAPAAADEKKPTDGAAAAAATPAKPASAGEKGEAQPQP